MSSLNANVMFKPFVKHLLFRNSVISEVGIWHQRSFFAAYRTDLFLQKRMCVARNGSQLSHIVPKVVVRRKSLRDLRPPRNVPRDFLSFRCSRDINGTFHLLMTQPVVIRRQLQVLGVGKILRCSVAILARVGLYKQKRRAFSFSLTENENQMLFVISRNFEFRMEVPSGQTWLI